MIPRLRAAVVLVLVSLFVGACGAADTTSATAPDQGAGATEPAAAVGIVANTTDGGQLAFDDLAGKPVVLWFWAPW